MKKILLVFLMVVMEVSALKMHIDVDRGSLKFNSKINETIPYDHAYEYEFNLTNPSVVKIIVDNDVPKICQDLNLYTDKGIQIETSYSSSVKENLTHHITRLIPSGQYRIEVYNLCSEYSFTLELKRKEIPIIDTIKLDSEKIEDVWSLESDISWANPKVYAHFYSLNIDKSKIINIDIISDIDNISYLYDAEGKQVWSDFSNPSSYYQVKKGKYILEVIPKKIDTLGSFSIAIKNKNIMQNIVLGSTTYGKWDDNHHAYYSFYLSETENISIGLVNGYTEINLYSEEGKITGIWEGPNPYLFATLKPGKYYIALEDLDWENNINNNEYTISLLSSSISFDSPTPIKLDSSELMIRGQWVSISPSSLFFNTQTKSEYYTFTVNKKSIVQIGLESGGDNFLILRNTNGDIIDSDDDSGEGYDAFMATTLDAGTYVIEATGYDAGKNMKDFKLNIKNLNFIPPYGWLPAIYHSILN